jgi:thiol:disulfide interchange protein DsbD
VYLLPGIFKTGTGEQGQRPRGVVYDWVDAFLLPEPGAASGEELPWGVDLPHSVKDAQELAQKTQQSQFVLVDFTGVTCTNCKANERSIFPLPAVKEQMRKYKLVQMYTDDVPADFYTIPPSLRQRQQEAEANLAFQKRVFGTEQLPLYVILEASPAGKVSVREVYSEGKINNTQAFVEFLAKPHAK